MHTNVTNNAMSICSQFNGYLFTKSNQLPLLDSNRFICQTIERNVTLLEVCLPLKIPIWLHLALKIIIAQSSKGLRKRYAKWTTITHSRYNYRVTTCLYKYLLIWYFGQSCKRQTIANCHHQQQWPQNWFAFAKCTLIKWTMVHQIQHHPLTRNITYYWQRV